MSKNCSIPLLAKLIAHILTNTCVDNVKRGYTDGVGCVRLWQETIYKENSQKNTSWVQRITQLNMWGTDFAKRALGTMGITRFKCTPSKVSYPCVIAPTECHPLRDGFCAAMAFFLLFFFERSFSQCVMQGVQGRVKLCTVINIRVVCELFHCKLSHVTAWHNQDRQHLLPTLVQSLHCTCIWKQFKTNCPCAGPIRLVMSVDGKRPKDLPW